MMRIINAFPGIGDPMTEEEIKNFLANNNNNLLIRIGLIDENRRLISNQLIYL